MLIIVEMLAASKTAVKSLHVQTFLRLSGVFLGVKTWSVALETNE